MTAIENKSSGPVKSGKRAAVIWEYSRRREIMESLMKTEVWFEAWRFMDYGGKIKEDFWSGTRRFWRYLLDRRFDQKMKDSLFETKVIDSEKQFCNGCRGFLPIKGFWIEKLIWQTRKEFNCGKEFDLTGKQIILMRQLVLNH